MDHVVGVSCSLRRICLVPGVRMEAGGLTQPGSMPSCCAAACASGSTLAAISAQLETIVF